MPIDALSVLCAQLTRDLLAIAKFLLSLAFVPSTPAMTIIDKITMTPMM